MSNHQHPVIRRRVPKSQRRRDGLIQFARDATSQNGEDGIIHHIFDKILPFSSQQQRVCVDVGAWDGKHLSNTYSLLLKKEVWQGLLIEADPDRFKELQTLHQSLGNACINTMVSCNETSPNSLVTLLRQHNFIPQNFDFLGIDVDGSDYWLLNQVLESKYRPKVICIEANPTMPHDLIYIPAKSDEIRHGASLAAIVELANMYDYVLVETTIYNAFFVPKELYDRYFQDLVPDTSIEALHEITMGTSIYQLYDGTLKLWGCKKLLWHRQTMNEEKMQILSPEQRQFPFAPPVMSFTNEDVIDISVYCCEPTHNTASNIDAQQQVHCAKAIVKQLQQDGFAFVRGTGICNQVCQRALSATHQLLQEAPESVRRSCLSKTDRARRGYSPMCTENFASLIGEGGPNDCVRKFRVGPSTQKDEGGDFSTSPLLRPNVWPSNQAWDSGVIFRDAIQRYYDEICVVAQAIVRAICDGLVGEKPDLALSLNSITKKDSLAHTSILTLLGYRKGSRHQQKKKNKEQPLVAAHTDVGVITVLLFDGGDCAMLQRQHKNSWQNVNLPPVLPEDPIFVVNIADCLSELSQNYVPSTLHRVMPVAGGTMPRNCLALFVGLDPKEHLHFTNGDRVETYEDWRKKRIAKSQKVLQKKNLT